MLLAKERSSFSSIAEIREFTRQCYIRFVGELDRFKKEILSRQAQEPHDPRQIVEEIVSSENHGLIRRVLGDCASRVVVMIDTIIQMQKRKKY